MVVRNKEFYNALLRLARELAIKFNTPNRYVKMERKFKITSSKSYDEVGERIERILYSNSTFIYNLKEFKDCKSIIVSDKHLSSHFWKLIRIHDSQQIMFRDFTIISIVANVIEHSKHQNINMDSFNELYNQFESFIYSDSIPIVYQFPLTYFRLNKELKISKELSIKKLTIAEREQWANFIIGYDISHIVFDTNFTIEYKIKVPKQIVQDEVSESKIKSQNIDNQIFEKMQNLVSALRLLKNGYFFDFCLIKKIDFDIPDNILRYQSKSYIDYSIGSGYKFYNSDVVKLKQKYILVDRLSSNSLIKNALLWLNEYSKERNFLKRIIYLAVVIETLLSDTSSEAITHKLKVRSANLIESKFSEKEKIFKNIGAFYTARSNLLHGRESKPFEGINTTDMYVRQIISKLLFIISNFKNESFEDQYNELLRKLDYGFDLN